MWDSKSEMAVPAQHIPEPPPLLSEPSLTETSISKSSIPTSMEYGDQMRYTNPPSYSEVPESETYSLDASQYLLDPSTAGSVIYENIGAVPSRESLASSRSSRSSTSGYRPLIKRLTSSSFGGSKNQNLMPRPLAINPDRITTGLQVSFPDAWGKPDVVRSKSEENVELLSNRISYGSTE